MRIWEGWLWNLIILQRDHVWDYRARTLSLNDFYTPERYVEEDYDYVYAIAVAFNQKTVNELEVKKEWYNGKISTDDGGRL